MRRLLRATGTPNGAAAHCLAMLQHIKGLALTTKETSNSVFYQHSVFYEKMTEQLFIAELLQEAWFGFNEKIEVLRSEVDDAGYDIVLECGGVLRHVQLKSSKADATTTSQKINVALTHKPSGCVVWILRAENREKRRMSLTYRFFGDAPGKPLPSMDQNRRRQRTKAASKGKKKGRNSARVVNKGQFKNVKNSKHLLQLLFGLKK